jgi:hypothetical protein
MARRLDGARLDATAGAYLAAPVCAAKVSFS